MCLSSPIFSEWLAMAHVHPCDLSQPDSAACEGLKLRDEVLAKTII